MVVHGAGGVGLLFGCDGLDTCELAGGACSALISALLALIVVGGGML